MCNRDKWSPLVNLTLFFCNVIMSSCRQWHNCALLQHGFTPPRRSIKRIVKNSNRSVTFFLVWREEWKYLWLYEALTENIMMDGVKMTLSIKSKYRMSSWDNCCDDVGNKCWWAETAAGQLLQYGKFEGIRSWELKRGDPKKWTLEYRNAAGKVSFGSDAEWVFGCSSLLASHTYIHRSPP